MATSSLIENLEDGSRALILEDNVRACAVVTLGDTDDDGKIGVRAILLADVPLDGSDEVEVVLDTGEQGEGAGMAAQRLVSDMLGELGRLIRFVPFVFRG